MADDDALLRALARECELLVHRLRDFTPARYAASTPPFADRAAVVRHLAERLVAAADVPHRLPVLPAMALADVLAVTARDLVTTRPGAPVAAEVLAEVLLHRRDLDAAEPGRAAAALALAVLDPGGPGTPERLLVVARGRCPAVS